MVTSYYFDTLPIHPQPMHLESSSSYITRIAQANEILSLSGLSTILSLKRLRIADGGFFVDLPPVSFGELPAVAVCSVARLLGTTFYHLLMKFNRPPLAQPASRFLAGSIAQRLRYCPMCLLEFGYYSLCWQFSMLTGCRYHSCQLLEKCRHCEQIIPFAVWLPKLGICPICKGDLRSCSAPFLTTIEQRNVSKCHQELEFLLTPHRCDMGGDKALQLLGHKLAGLRKARGESRLEFARTIEEPYHILFNAESGDPLRYGVTFQTYMKYARHLQVTLSSLLDAGVYEESLTGGTEEYKSYRTSRSAVTIAEDELLTKVREAVERIICSGKRVTKRSVARMLQTYPEALCRFESIRRFLEQAIEHPVLNSSNCSETEFLNKVKLGVEHLKLKGIPITQLAVAKETSINQAVLRHCSSAKAIIDRAIEECRAMRLKQREDELISGMQEALRTLYAQGKSKSRTAICREIHQTLVTVKRYPRALVFLDQLMSSMCGKQEQGEAEEPPNYEQEDAHVKTIQQFQKREEDLIRQISCAIEDLQLHNVYVTQKGIARYLKITIGGLKYYPRAKGHLERAVKYAQENQFDQREEVLLTQVESAVQQLEAQGKSVTAGSIGELLHMPESTIKYYPRVCATLKQFSNERAEKRVQERTARLADRIKSSMKALESSDAPVNYLTVSELTGVSISVLRRDTQLQKMIEVAQENP